MNRLLLTLLAAAAASSVSAAAVRNVFRIDLQGDKGLGMVYKNGSEGTTGSQAGWLKEKKDTRLIVTGPISQEWKEFSFTFVPKADGKVSLNLMSDNPKFQVSYDNIRVTGATIANGDFETAAKQADRPDRWWPMGKPGFVKEAQGGSGKNFVTCAHNDRWNQPISCKAGEAVTVTFQAKLAEAPKAAK